MSALEALLRRLHKHVSPARPLYRWRWSRCRAFEPAPWNYVHATSEEEVKRLLNAPSAVEIEPVSAESVAEDLRRAFEAGAASEHFAGSGRNKCALRLSVRRRTRELEAA